MNSGSVLGCEYNIFRINIRAQVGQTLFYARVFKIHTRKFEFPAEIYGRESWEKLGRELKTQAQNKVNR